MDNKAMLIKALDDGNGVFRLAPTWVPRSFCRPGMRLKLHPDDYFALGLSRGGIDERWFSSTTHAENGPETADDEGLSYIVIGDDKITLLEAVELLKGDLIGDELYNKYGKWPMYSKFFDNLGPLPHHIHHSWEYAKNVGKEGKPEMYFFPSQQNNHGGEFAYTFFGLNPMTTREQVAECLRNFGKGDNKILDLSKAYKLTLDTGWDVPPGVLHAPGSLCTYEPQFASDIFSMYQSVLYGGHCVSEDLLWENTPDSKKGDVDYMIDIIDWELNVDPYFYENRFMAPKPARPQEEMIGYVDEWICYKSKYACAKRLTIKPGAKVTIKDGGAHGIICIQGKGEIAGQPMESPTLIRYGQLTCDEFFVSHTAAANGVTLKNTSNTEDLVMLKHFAENGDLEL